MIIRVIRPSHFTSRVWQDEDYGHFDQANRAVGRDGVGEIAGLYPKNRHLPAKVRVLLMFMTELSTALKRVDMLVT